MVTRSVLGPGVLRRAVAVIGVLFLLLISINSLAAVQQPDHRWLDVALEIALPDGSKRPVRSGLSTMILRRQLTVNDASAPSDFTGIHISTKPDGDAITVELSIIYNNASDQQAVWGERLKLVGSYQIAMGETVRPAELTAFGIEPLEMKVIDARPVVFKPGEGPRVINKTTALEVAHFEKQLDQCKVSLKNTSNKNVVAYSISVGGSSTGSGTGARGRSLADTIMAPGAVGRGDYLQCSDPDRDSLTILNVIFDDGTFEGDAKSARQFLVSMEGVGIQAPHVLRRIKQTLAVDDGDLRAAFDRLEAELWLIPEAIDKQSALELLTKKFPALDQKTVSELYENLKGGLYDSRNIALSSLGQTQRSARALEEQGQFASAAELMRKVLEDLKETFERITSLHR